MDETQETKHSSHSHDAWNPFRRLSGRRRRVSNCKKPMKQNFPLWRELSVTYRKFTKLPMRTQQARRTGWEKEEDGCKDDLFYVGQRYVYRQNGNEKDWDRATLLLFDVHGHIAGIQMEISAANKIDQFNRFPPFIVGKTGARYLTAYFTDPQNICNKKIRRNTRMVGDRLMILNSNKTMPDGSLINVPLKESWMYGTLWNKGGCVPAMGRHYFFNMTANMNCSDFVPLFLLYNKGVLNGFGWTMGGHINSPTGRLEYAPNALLRKFFQPGIEWPLCLDDRSVSQPSVSSQHIYLDINPTKNLC
ncbi:uncharacterized protein LOC130636478 isoform X2 [Hydractinia symbiolongicarpus]|uniref:uncharacterized protein LOC130636478 isoform X2 n=1 Tax=Hydractinia symbiolongicarpus TaxID=13093 RepID=UPI002550B23F|nr:uncharacterized protein LOC130636478 isoform X2 [Hydractinia symbiolongicarpus]